MSWCDDDDDTNAPAVFAWSMVGTLVLLLMLGIVKPATLDPAALAAQPDALIVQHAYDGPIESAGALVDYQYTGGHMLIGWVDTTTDGVFRNAFEAAP